MYRSYGKRFFDIISAAAGLIILSPLFVFIILLLSFSNKGNPFFIQPRPGLNDKIFLILKFKTMLDLFDENGKYLPDNERITGIGKFLRQTSLDEIPQLWNVLRGEMSLVGPRPLLVEYLPLYSASQLKRHHVKPGLTGLAQINGRNTISWEQKFNYDLRYVENISFFFDLRILLTTAQNLIFSKNAAMKINKPAKKFTGFATFTF